ncbi:MAG: MoaD/ThiS family protein [Desulfobacterales bacterium]|nr:MoaD/ThiS family protein [Desulfobacterales bacterium]
MINIELRLFANLSKFSPKNSKNFPIDNNMSVKQLISKLGVDIDQAKIIFINSRKKNYDDRLKDGDKVGIFPPVGG